MRETARHCCHLTFCGWPGGRDRSTAGALRGVVGRGDMAVIVSRAVTTVAAAPKKLNASVWRLMPKNTQEERDAKPLLCFSLTAQRVCVYNPTCNGQDRRDHADHPGGRPEDLPVPAVMAVAGKPLRGRDAGQDESAPARSQSSRPSAARSAPRTEDLRSRTGAPGRRWRNR